ncbi:SDR family NAD(P)-dependent oxidoreductase [bacterium]|nr:SDR family NAD(P)-dependent oxidoreductase [bacterium]
MKQSLTTKTAVVTGASSGIGAALARELARAGCNIVIFGRRKERLEALRKELEDTCGVRVLPFSVDIRNERKMASSIESAANTLGTIDLVFANAGFTIPGACEQLHPDDYRTIFDTNFCGMLNTLYPAFPHLKQSGGVLVIVGSILGEFGIMERSAYVATKFALRGFYESVRYELKEAGIRCLLAEPGFVRTELRYMDKKGNRLEALTDTAKKKTSHGIAVSPEAVAAAIVRAIPSRGYRKRIITGHATIFAFLNWLMPGPLSALVYAKREFFRRKVVK